MLGILICFIGCNLKCSPLREPGSFPIRSRATLIIMPSGLLSANGEIGEDVKERKGKWKLKENFLVVYRIGALECINELPLNGGRH